MNEDNKRIQIFYNGDIKTCDIDGKLYQFSAMAIENEKILAIGSDDEILAYKDKALSMQNLNGNTVLPGLCDAHLHASSTREITEPFDFYDTCEGDPTRDQVISMVQKTIREYMKVNDISTGVRITGWNPLAFANSKEGFPTAKDLDSVCPDVPVVLRSVCQHYVWTNTKALEKAGISKETKDPKNGLIYRDEEGNPTGIFQELPAVNLMKRTLPEADYTVDEYKESILKFQEKFAKPVGITMICDAMATPNAVEAYEELASEGKLEMRVSGVYPADSDLPDTQFDEFIKRKGKDYIGDIYHIPTVKFFVDGVEFMFYMCEPFEKEANVKAGYPEDYRGFPQWNLEDAKRIFLKLDKAGFQIHVHAMGDAAVKLTLDAFQYVREMNPDSHNRHAIAHVMNIRLEDIQRMADLNVIGSIQPTWGAMESHEAANSKMMGKKRIEEAYPFGLLAKAGVRLASGTDFPIVPILNPFQGIEIGMTRAIPKSHPDYEEWHKVIRGGEENKINFETMLASYTINGAYEMFFDDITGSLEPGKSADFVVLPCCLSDMDIEEYENIRPSEVWFKGRKTFSREG